MIIDHALKQTELLMTVVYFMLHQVTTARSKTVVMINIKLLNLYSNLEIL